MVVKNIREVFVLKKSSVFKYAAFLIFLAIFNLVFWLVADVDNMSTTNWIAYGVIHGSYLLIILSGLFTGKHEDAYVGKSLLRSVSTAFFPLQFILGIIFIIPDTDASWFLKLAIGVFGVVTLIYIACVLVVLFASGSSAEERAGVEAARNAKVSVASLRVIRARTTDGDIQAKIDALLDRSELVAVTPDKAMAFAQASKRLERAVKASEKSVAMAAADELLAILG